MRDRHLAPAEAPDLDLVLGLVETGGETFTKFALADDHLELTLETADGGLANLHDVCLNRPVGSDRSDRACGTICPALCDAAVVRAEGLEPPRLASQEPKSCASASSATPAGLATPSSAALLRRRRSPRCHRAAMAGLSDRLVAGWGAISREPVSDREDHSTAPTSRRRGNGRRTDPHPAPGLAHSVPLLRRSPPRQRRDAGQPLNCGLQLRYSTPAMNSSLEPWAAG